MRLLFSTVLSGSFAILWLIGFLDNLTDEMGIFYLCMSAFMFAIAYFSYSFYTKQKGARDSNLNDFNSKGDGIYHHFMQYGDDRYAITVDTNNQTVALISGKSERTFRFDEISSWEYRLDGETIVSATGVYGGGMAGATAATMAGMQAIALKGQADKKHLENSGFFIRTTDIAQPLWHIRFWGKSVGYSGNAFWKDVLQQCESWINVFNKTINGK